MRGSGACHEGPAGLASISYQGTNGRSGGSCIGREYPTGIQNIAGYGFATEKEPQVATGTHLADFPGKDT
jgi:hypothetical protein